MKPLSDEKLRSYFLGKLPESEADALEMECADSEELTSQAQMIERELADDYLRGNLTSADISLFETNYLISESRHKKVRAAQSLWEIANEPKAAKNLPLPPTTNASWKDFFLHRKIFQLAFTCLLLLFAFGAIVLYLLTLNVGKEEVAEVKEVKEVNYATPKVEIPPMPDGVADLQPPKVIKPNPVVNNNEIENREVEKEFPLPQKTPTDSKPLVKPTVKSEIKISKVPSFATFVLFSGTMRSEGEQFITIAPNINKVNLLLNLPGEAKVYKTYRVSLKTADGDTVYTSPNLNALSFSFPTEKLDNRTYIIFLEGQNAQREFESITEYTFRVRR